MALAGSPQSDSAWTDSITITLPLLRLKAPRALDFDPATKQISWASVDNANGYTVRIYQCHHAAPNEVSVTDAAYSLTEDAKQINHAIQVQSVRHGYANEPNSAWSTALVLCPPPPTPTPTPRPSATERPSPPDDGDDDVWTCTRGNPYTERRTRIIENGGDCFSVRQERQARNKRCYKNGKFVFQEVEVLSNWRNTSVKPISCP